MTIVSNNPLWWPTIDASVACGYVSVAALSMVLYDWALSVRQEWELIWRQRWSLVTVLYLSMRYIGIPWSVLNVMTYIPFVSLTDAGCADFFFVTNLVSIVVNILLGVIMIISLHAMYQRSRKMLAFLIVIFMAVQIACGVIFAVLNERISVEEVILSGTHLCYSSSSVEGNTVFLTEMTWVLGTAWGVLALCLVVWISMEHFRELRQPSTAAGLAVWDCLTTLIKTHVFYFVSCALQLCYFSKPFSDPDSEGSEIFGGVLQMAAVVQTFMLGPRIILGIRGYQAKLMADSYEETGMTSAFVHISSGGSV